MPRDTRGVGWRSLHGQDRSKNGRFLRGLTGCEIGLGIGRAASWAKNTFGRIYFTKTAPAAQRAAHFASHLSHCLANSSTFSFVTRVSGSMTRGESGGLFLTILSSRICTDL